MVKYVHDNRVSLASKLSMPSAAAASLATPLGGQDTMLPTAMLTMSAQQLYHR